MRTSSKKQKKSGTISELPSKKEKIPRNTLHATSFRYILLKASNRNDYMLINNPKPYHYNTDWTQQGRKIGKALKSIMRTPRVHQWRSIRHFELDLSKQSETTMNDLKVWERLDLSTFRHLRKFTFCASEGITDKNIESLAYSVRQFSTPLNSLALRFMPHSYVTSQGLQRYLFQISKHCNNVQELNINFSKSIMTNQDILEPALFSFMKRFANARKFSLHFCFDFFVNTENHIKNKIMKSIGMVISRYFEHLRELKVSFELKESDSKPVYRYLKKTSDDKYPIEVFINQLAKLRTLDKLALSLNWSERVSEKSLTFVAQLIATKLTSLAHLSLIFKRCQQIVGKDIKQFGNELCKCCSNLKYLEIDFQMCLGLVPSDLKALQTKLKKALPHLEMLVMQGVKV